MAGTPSQQTGIIYSEQLDRLKRFLHSQNPLLLVVGEQGSGKTELLTQIVSQLKVTRHIIRMQGSVNLSPTDLTNVLTTHWASGELKNKNTRLEVQLREIIDNLAHHDQTCLLVIDDAHLLPLAMLAAIAYLAMQQEGKKVYLHLLLSGRPKLTERFDCLYNRQTPQIKMGALTREETYKKIHDYLIKSGIELPVSVSNSLMHKIYSKSGGMPGLIQNLMEDIQVENNKFLNKKLEQVQNTKPSSIYWKQHGIKTFAILGLIFIGFIMWGFNHPNKIPILWTENTIQFVNQPPPKAKIPQLAKRAVAVITTPKQDIHFIKKTGAKKPETKALVVAATSASKPSEVLRAVALHNAIKQHYFALQLMSGTNKKVLESYIKKHHLEKMAKTMHTTYKGIDWYILVYGHYSSSSTAEKALKTLPKQIKKLHPWIRPMHTASEMV